MNSNSNWYDSFVILFYGKRDLKITYLVSPSVLSALVAKKKTTPKCSLFEMSWKLISACDQTRRQKCRCDGYRPLAQRGRGDGGSR